MFYKFENNQLYCNGTVMGDLYSLYKEEDGWYWFNDETQALETLCENYEQLSAEQIQNCCSNVIYVDL